AVASGTARKDHCAYDDEPAGLFGGGRNWFPDAPGEKISGQAPDWRPQETIPEDFYAMSAYGALDDPEEMPWSWHPQSPEYPPPVHPDPEMTLRANDPQSGWEPAPQFEFDYQPGMQPQGAGYPQSGAFHTYDPTTDPGAAGATTQAPVPPKEP